MSVCMHMCTHGRQVCISPDVVLVDQSVEKKFLEALKNETATCYGSSLVEHGVGSPAEEKDQVGFDQPTTLTTVALFTIRHDLPCMGSGSLGKDRQRASYREAVGTGQGMRRGPCARGLQGAAICGAVVSSAVVSSAVVSSAVVSSAVVSSAVVSSAVVSK